MIKLENIIIGSLGPVSFEIRPCAACKIITGSNEDKALLLNAILGLQRPEGGKVFLFGKEIYSISDSDCIKLYRMVGVAPERGGLISNLKVWENIVLPLQYHTGKIPADADGKAAGIFKEIGIERSELEELTGRLPGPLPVNEKRLIGLVRAMLMEPELMIYDSLFEGLSPELAGRLARLTGRFHAGRQGRASVYLSANALSLEGVSAGQVIDLSNEGTRGVHGVV
ncbi:MAG: ATP-binding cassette domain-containing protein [Thermodesulfovibrionales bacterium]|nr:ATP-binding cassette domain-containing protein [Thermodesulfovibrionales bacterium]